MKATQISRRAMDGGMRLALGTALILVLGACASVDRVTGTTWPERRAVYLEIIAAATTPVERAAAERAMAVGDAVYAAQPHGPEYDEHGRRIVRAPSLVDPQ